ncbi:MAG TPA: hypothetical protein VKA21_00690 [Candidatus Binatia bacterium]|nr:hypothetical protein [Candidatus Binatia bacterium]
MVPGDIDPSVRRFIVDRIDSVEMLEVLLLLRAEPERWWNAGQVNAAVRTSLTSAADRLHDLAARGLLAVDTTSPPLYRYRPRDAATDAVVGRVAEAYRERRVSVITLLYSKPQDPVRDLAEAFRLRKGRTDG